MCVFACVNKLTISGFCLPGACFVLLIDVHLLVCFTVLWLPFCEIDK